MVKRALGAPSSGYVEISLKKLHVETAALGCLAERSSARSSLAFHIATGRQRSIQHKCLRRVLSLHRDGRTDVGSFAAASPPFRMTGLLFAHSPWDLWECGLTASRAWLGQTAEGGCLHMDLYFADLTSLIRASRLSSLSRKKVIHRS